MVEQGYGYYKGIDTMPLVICMSRTLEKQPPGARNPQGYLNHLQEANHLGFIGRNNSTRTTCVRTVGQPC